MASGSFVTPSRPLPPPPYPRTDPRSPSYSPSHLLPTENGGTGVPAQPNGVRTGDVGRVFTASSTAMMTFFESTHSGGWAHEIYEQNFTRRNATPAGTLRRDAEGRLWCMGVDGQEILVQQTDHLTDAQRSLLDGLRGVEKPSTENPNAVDMQALPQERRRALEMEP